jgi:hypothetical protein
MPRAVRGSTVFLNPGAGISAFAGQVVWRGVAGLLSSGVLAPVSQMYSSMNQSSYPAVLKLFDAILYDDATEEPIRAKAFKVDGPKPASDIVFMELPDDPLDPNYGHIRVTWIGHDVQELTISVDGYEPHTMTEGSFNKVGDCFPMWARLGPHRIFLKPKSDERTA